MFRTSASSAAARHPAASARRAASPTFPRLRAMAFTLASIISKPLKRDDQRLSAQDQALGNIALLQARKGILFHRKEELIAELAGAKAHPRKDRPASLIRAELQRVTTEILSIG